jgi:hypothetical protein
MWLQGEKGLERRQFPKERWVKHVMWLGDNMFLEEKMGA